MLFFGSENWNQFTAEKLEKLRELGLKPDAEREKRYEQIDDALELNPDLRLPLLDKVLPLPPAELPPWNGVQSAIEPEADGPPSY
jgi:hypothetical protein